MVTKKIDDRYIKVGGYYRAAYQAQWEVGLSFLILAGAGGEGSNDPSPPFPLRKEKASGLPNLPPPFFRDGGALAVDNSPVLSQFWYSSVGRCP